MQKTAYEMRISDWSSDVCSSDLVFKVAFSDDDDNRLTTCGTGHIRYACTKIYICCFASTRPQIKMLPHRFWKMASTFTGLKLQGAIGKFGKVELRSEERRDGEE